jgi:hypothetical protein
MEAAMATVILDHTRVTHKKLPLGRVPAGGEYYAGYREALLNLETAIRARDRV